MKHLRLVTQRPAPAQTVFTGFLVFLANAFGALVGAFNDDRTAIEVGDDTPGIFRNILFGFGKNVGSGVS